MEDKALKIKTGIVAVINAVLAFIGWRGTLVLIWCVVMLLDWISGSYAAHKSGEWTSKQSREGVAHKVGSMLVVGACLLTDLLVLLGLTFFDVGFNYPCLLMPLAVVWYIFTEIGSILENAAKMGANVPDWLVKGLKATVKKIDKTGENLIKEE